MNLFDIIEIEEDKEAVECQHKQEKQTLTVWPGELHERWTWTCVVCGRIRGRITNRRE